MATLMACVLAMVAASLLVVPGALTLSCTRTTLGFPAPSPLPVTVDIEECSGEQVVLSLYSNDPVPEVEYLCIDPTSAEGIEQSGTFFFEGRMSQRELRSVTDLTPGVICSFSGCYAFPLVDFTIQPTACTLRSKVAEVTETLQVSQSLVTSYSYSEDLLMPMDTTEMLLMPMDTTEIVSHPLPTMSPPPNQQIPQGSGSNDATILAPLGSGIDASAISPWSLSTIPVTYSSSWISSSPTEHTSTPTPSAESASPTSDPSMVPQSSVPLHPWWIILAVVLGVTASVAVAVGFLLMCMVALQRRGKRETERSAKSLMTVAEEMAHQLTATTTESSTTSTYPQCREVPHPLDPQTTSAAGLVQWSNYKVLH